MKFSPKKWLKTVVQYLDKWVDTYVFLFFYFIVTLKPNIKIKTQYNSQSKTVFKIYVPSCVTDPFGVWPKTE